MGIFEDLKIKKMFTSLRIPFVITSSGLMGCYLSFMFISANICQIMHPSRLQKLDFLVNFCMTSIRSPILMFCCPKVGLGECVFVTLHTALLLNLGCSSTKDLPGIFTIKEEVACGIPTYFRQHNVIMEILVGR